MDNKNRIKTGKIVQIRSWEDMAQEYGLSEEGWILIPGMYRFVEPMRHVCGTTGKVTRANDENNFTIRIEGIPDWWIITLPMIKCDWVVENQL